jgi:hypothetical protein
VSDENAEVTLRDPGHPVFTRPNRITAFRLFANLMAR